MQLRIHVSTDVGRVRDHNEDSVASDALERFVIVADGMGGHNAGEVASQIAIETIGRTLKCALGPADDRWRTADPPDGGWLRYAITTANRAIRRAGRVDAARSGMGTTVVALMPTGDRVEIAHVGDSRAYRLREGILTQLTRDHSMRAEMDALAANDAAFRSFLQQSGYPPSNIITRALGIADSVEVDVCSDETRAGDVYLLCSDGLSGMVRDSAIAAIVSGVTDGATACSALIDAANAGGGEDNVTVALVRVS